MTNDDRELLVFAAKAAGIPIYAWEYNERLETWFGKRADSEEETVYWNPLVNDVDAFRLTVTLGITSMPYPIYSQSKHSVVAKQHRNTDLMRKQNPTEVVETYGCVPMAATRRAIVRCAALIGSSPFDKGGD